MEENLIRVLCQINHELAQMANTLNPLPIFLKKRLIQRGNQVLLREWENNPTSYWNSVCYN